MFLRSPTYAPSRLATNYLLQHLTVVWTLVAPTHTPGTAEKEATAQHQRSLSRPDKENASWRVRTFAVR